ncbi:MAG: DNA polymerase III subunit beta [Chlamydiae bacterium]|nr:DNA polymerase III subunit beta [Chlamydiota bacterium]
MKVIISKTDLTSLIGRVQSIIPTKPAIPIAANILIEALDDQLILTATDLTVSMRVHAEAKVEIEGSITLPAKKFFQLIKELTAPLVEIHLQTPEIATINSGSSHFKIHGMTKEEFPDLPDITSGSVIDLPSQTLKEVLAKTAFAAAREDSRQMLNGVSLQLNQSSATFIGTDGKKLAKAMTTLDASSQASGSYILPIKAVEEIVRLLDPKEDRVKATLLPDMIAVEVGASLLISKLIAGQYPDIARIIPEKQQNPIKLHREELTSLLRQVSLFTAETSPSVRFTFTTGELHLSANSGEVGEGKVHMPANFGGEKLEVAFNPNYFIDILRHSKDETVNFEVRDSYNPGMITDSSNTLFVLMPMRLDV